MNGLRGYPHDECHRRIEVPAALVGDIAPAWADLQCLFIHA